MTPLTPDEVIARSRAHWPAHQTSLLEMQLNVLSQLGLVVVDATDTPNEVHDYAGSPVWCKTHQSFTCPKIEASPGGSPGERGTVTQETSADDELWTLAERVLEHVPFGAYEGWKRDGNSGDADRMSEWDHDRIALLKLLRAATWPPPFPNAYPGPQVDGQPTWGAALDVVPHKGYEVTGDMGRDWRSIDDVIDDWSPSFWVLVRHTPQPEAPPERWTVEHPDGVAAGLLLDGGTVCAHVYHPFDADAIARKLNAVEVLVENEKTGT